MVCSLRLLISPLFKTKTLPVPWPYVLKYYLLLQKPTISPMNTQLCYFSLWINVTAFGSYVFPYQALGFVWCVCAGVWTCDHLFLCTLWDVLSLITKKHLLIVENKISILIWIYTAHNQLFGVQGPGPKGTSTGMLWRQCWQVQKMQDNWRTYQYMWHRISWGHMRVMKQYALLKLRSYLCNCWRPVHDTT